MNANVVQISPVTLALLGCLLTILSSVMSIWLTMIFAGMGKVTVSLFNEHKRELTEKRKQAWSDHQVFCPANRRVLIKEDHDEDCAKVIKPIKDGLERIEGVLRKVQENQAQMVTDEKFRQLILELHGGNQA